MIKIVSRNPELLRKYQNGNATVELFADGTRVISTDDDEFKFDFPCSIDLTITKACDHGCKFCYLNCVPNGRHANLNAPSFLDKLPSGMEVAINLNSLDIPGLSKFLVRMRDRGVIVNGTINQDHFMKYHKVLKGLCNANNLRGLGVSLTKPTPEFVELIKTFPNAVIHVINGVFSGSDFDALRDNGLKMLILGYKNIGRGTSYSEDNDVVIKVRQRYLYDVLPTLVNHFDVVSFDGLALEQLNVKRLLTDEEWNTLYQGDEGSCSMYVDLVDHYFALNSMVNDPIHQYPIMDTIESMFKVIQAERAA